MLEVIVAPSIIRFDVRKYDRAAIQCRSVTTCDSTGAVKRTVLVFLRRSASKIVTACLRSQLCLLPGSVRLVLTYRSISAPRQHRLAPHCGYIKIHSILL